MAMSRADAIALIKDIQSGVGVDRNKSKTVLDHRGSIAVLLWGDGIFSLGFEYGVLFALAETFDIDLSDLSGVENGYSR